MSTLKTNKINRLLLDWQKGNVKLAGYLQENGYQKDLLKKYVSSGWLESLGYGAYKLRRDDVGWEGAVKALQEQKNLNIHPGGKTALELKGFGHYYRQESSKVHLFGNRVDNLPKWFTNQEWMNRITYVKTNLFDFGLLLPSSEVQINNILIKVSAPELAAMEMIHLIPKEQSFAEAYLVMESLTTLRPKLVQKLLESCSSIKVKRIFMWMAEKSGHSWIGDLNLGNVNFGSGKRVVVKDGELDKKYNITVPKSHEK